MKQRYALYVSIFLPTAAVCDYLTIGVKISYRTLSASLYGTLRVVKVILKIIDKKKTFETKSAVCL